MTMATRGLNLRPGTLLRVELRDSVTLYAEPWGRCTGVVTRDELLTVLTAGVGEAAPSPGSNVGWVTSIVLAQQDRVTP